jgi:hypothetical protein
MCVNSPWRDWAFKLIIETAKTGVDGIFLDGPVVFPGCCHCETCQRLFHEKTGAEIPEKEDWSNPLWKKFMAFREESMAIFLRDARKALHSINPDAIIYLNGANGVMKLPVLHSSLNRIGISPVPKLFSIRALIFMICMLL